MSERSAGKNEIDGNHRWASGLTNFAGIDGFSPETEAQDQMYDAHQNEKKSHQRQKAIMTQLNLPVSDGSEGVITPKDEWISKIKWSDDDEAGPSGTQESP